MSFDRSPCVDCPRRDKGKTQCSAVCERLQAWKDLDPMWEQIEIPRPEELGEEPEVGLRPAGAYAPEGGDMKSQEICKVEGCTNEAKVRGVCLRCYDKWRQGRLEGLPPFTVAEKKISRAVKKARAKTNSHKTCKVEGCDRPVHARGACSSCYKKWRTDGLPGFPPFTVIGKNISDGMKKARGQRSEVQSPRSASGPPGCKPIRAGSPDGLRPGGEVQTPEKEAAAPEAEMSEKEMSVVRDRFLVTLNTGLRALDDMLDETIERRAAANADALLSTVVAVARPMMIQAFVCGHRCRREDGKGK